MKYTQVFVSYGKNHKYVDCRTVADVDKFIEETINNVRNIWGWKKTLTFEIRNRDGRRWETETRVFN